MAERDRQETPRPGEGGPDAAVDELRLSATALSALRHDLRTPIHQILGYSEMLEEDAGASDKPELARDLGRIKSAARRLLELVDGLAATVRPARTDTPAPDFDVDRTGPIRVDPLAPEGADVSSEAVEPATLLVVDDNEANRDVLCRRLQLHGYTADAAEGGEQALAAIGEKSYDLVLLDVVMPGLSGLDVLARLRRTHAASDLPVIMATARDDSRDVVTALRLGANDYVTKPLDLPVVLARVKTQLGLKRAKDRIASLASDLELRNRFIYETFGRYLSSEVVANLLRTPEGLSLGGESRKVTLLMSDLRGFTPLAERIPPDRVVKLLNNYLGTMADVLLEFQGTIDEFIGDAILAIFGAPVARDDDAERAVACAVAMQQAMERVNQFNRREGLPQLEMGIAVHTGEVIVGNIGSHRRAKYGVVGTAVNLTARIESYTVGGQVLISERTRREAGPEVAVAGEEVVVQMKGFERPLTAYDVRGVGGDFSLFLPARDEPLADLPQPLPLRFVVLNDKRVEGPEREGLLTRLSMKEAEIESRERPGPYANVRVQLVSRDGARMPGDVYGKVGAEGSAGSKGFLLRFTSIPPEVRSFFEALRPRDRS